MFNNKFTKAYLKIINESVSYNVIFSDYNESKPNEILGEFNTLEEAKLYLDKEVNSVIEQLQKDGINPSIESGELFVAIKEFGEWTITNQEI